jgi:maltose O-acetyltransferase
VSVTLHLHNVVSALLPSRGSFALKRLLLRTAGVVVGARARIATGARVYDRYLEIGDETWVGIETCIVSCPAGPVRIGARVDIAPMCIIDSGTHEMGSELRRAGRGTGKPISIGDGCWIGMRSAILPGATIGTGCVVGAGTVVTAGVYPANSLIVGVPGKVVRTLE